MTKTRYRSLVAVASLATAGISYGALLEINRISDWNFEKILAYFFMFTGFSLFYFGFLRPHWFAKELIPAATAIKLKIKKEINKQPSLKDDSYFWNVFPHALFFSVAGIAYFLQPNPYSILVAFGCSAWVKILYKYV
jgi:hypothetical protein